MAGLGHHNRLSTGCAPASHAAGQTRTARSLPAALPPVLLPTTCGCHMYHLQAVDVFHQSTPSDAAAPLAAATCTNRVTGTHCATHATLHLNLTQNHLPAHDAQTAKADAATARSAACTSPSWLCPLACGLLFRHKPAALVCNQHGIALCRVSMHDRGAGSVGRRVIVHHQGAHLWLIAGAGGVQPRAEGSARQSAGFPNTTCR